MGCDLYLYDENVKDNFSGRQVSTTEVLNEDWSAVVVSPGWLPSHPMILNLIGRKITVLNEIDLAWEIKNVIAPAQKWIAITGTNGKTSTVELTTAIFQEAGLNVIACGNVGTPVIQAIAAETSYDYLIIELSSFQLHWLESAKFTAGSILNIASDHIDWHGSFIEYANSKLKLLSLSAVNILNGDDGEVVVGSSKSKVEKIFYSLATPKPGEIGLVEDLLVDRAFVGDPMEAAMICELKEVIPTAPHVVSNSLAAAGLARSAGISHEVIRAAIKGFRPGRHRIELVMESKGIKWVDDSKATNPHAAQASVMSELSVVWIAGGLAKGAQMGAFIKQVGSRLKGVVLIGTDRELIATELAQYCPQVPVVRIDPEVGFDRLAIANNFMDQVVTAAKTLAEEGDVVLLAPACASMDQFKSYGDRGDRFAKSVREIVGEK
jgi:UDP-N-acetylmuramoylalanine--D-glutamate ligase